MSVNFDPSAVMLGKKDAVLDPRTARLSDYTTASTPSAPAQAHWGNMVPLPMDGNDSYGDCVEAEFDHQARVWAWHTAKPYSSTDNDILGSYSAITGFSKNDPNSDQGTDMLAANKYWVKKGLCGVKADAFTSVDPSNLEEVKFAVAEFGGCDIGIQLPISAQNQTFNGPWSVVTGPDAQPGSWGGHCVIITGYTASLNMFWVATWGGLQAMTFEFFQTYADEAYAMLSHEWIAANEMSPSHLAYGQLQAYLANV